MDRRAAGASGGSCRIQEVALSVYDFLDYRQYLKAYYEAEKERMASSIRCEFCR